MTTMRKAVRDAWVAALRSGEYQQTIGALSRKNADDTRGYCCLGVLCEVARKDGLGIEIVEDHDTRLYDGVSGELPDSVAEWAELTYGVYQLDQNPILGDHDAAEWNDGYDYDEETGEESRASFAEIADLIEEHIDVIEDGDAA
jgi:hypothetical protein